MALNFAFSWPRGSDFESEKLGSLATDHLKDWTTLAWSRSTRIMALYDCHLSSRLSRPCFSRVVDARLVTVADLQQKATLFNMRPMLWIR